MIFRPRGDGSFEVLLLRRATEPYRGEWFTVDGRVDPGETPREAALREIAEETSLSPRLLVRNLGAPDHVSTVRGRVRLYGFVAYVDVRSEAILNPEHSEAGWFGLDQALALLPLASQRDALRCARKRILIEPPPRRHGSGPVGLEHAGVRNVYGSARSSAAASLRVIPSLIRSLIRFVRIH